jgi:hypothetical protein
MERAIINVFGRLPPETRDTPDEEVRHEVELLVQSFIFHIFGAADNLAWLWVSERDVRKADGSPLAERAIGIRKQAVVNAFPERLRTLIEQRAPWFSYLENFRHALAHRIPLYVPPYIVNHDNEVAYRALDRRMSQALQRFDVDEHTRLKAQQRELTVFRAWMQHSFEEEARPVAFHAQMLQDFAIIEELALAVLEALQLPRDHQA